MGTGLIINGSHVTVPGLDVTNFEDDPRLRLAPEDFRLRAPHEQSWIHLLVFHTTGGIPGGNDLRPQVIKPGIGLSTGGGQRIVASWTHDRNRHGGAHLVVDQDGRAYCCADLGRVAAYHAEKANGCSIGIEVVQGHADADLYEGQIEAAVQLGLWVCRLMPIPIQWQIPTPYQGEPVPRFESSMHSAAGIFAFGDVCGIVGHRDLTSSRGSGDPGDAIMDALQLAGCERFDFSRREDLATWTDRQMQLGVWFADGSPGPMTADALKKAGYTDGIWRLGAPKPRN